MPKEITLALIIFTLVVLLILIACHKAQPKPEWELWEFTAYCSKKCCTKKWDDGHFASGKEIYFGGVAADRRLPFGAQIETRTPIKGLTKFVVEDRGSAIKRNRIDVFFPEEMGGHQAALEFGRQKRWVKIN